MAARVCAVLAVLVSRLALGSTALRVSGGLEPKAAAGPSTWRRCGREGDPLPAAGLVRFGWGKQWVEAGDVEEGAPCSAASFGADPAPHIRKVCECIRGERDELGFRWRRCASEGQTCSCQGDGTVVRFGFGARWVASHSREDVSARNCSAKSFRGENPAIGSTKECWCGERLPDVKKVRTAIVLVSRTPPDLRTWLTYHLDYVGVDHVFMQLEDSPDTTKQFEALPPALQRRVTRWDGGTAGGGKDEGPTDDFQTLQSLELAAMSRAHAEAKKINIDWLLQVDDDELVYVPTHRKINDVFSHLPKAYEQVFVPNVEAVYDSATEQKCFTQAREVSVSPQSFVSYADGKAAVRIGTPDDAVPASPRLWRRQGGSDLASGHLDKEPFGSPVLILHYESCTFQRWKEKFAQLSETSDERISEIPFTFYRDSIRISRFCASAPPALRRTQCADDKLKGLWASWKTEKNSQFRREDLMPLDIPWRMVLGN